MTATEAINKVIQIAENEVGYLEKRTNASLYDKTANAGSKNYTKYWAEIAPEFQAQAWCAAFITWILTQAYGQSAAKKLLGHYPYISCIKGKEKAKSQNRWTRSPSVGDIIIFGDSNGTPCHTGIVYAYDNNRVYTIEGNTSGGTTVIANGGGVYKKSYIRGISRILGYWHIDYEYAAHIMSENETEGIDMEELAKIKAEMAAMSAKYDTIINRMGAEIAQLKQDTAAPMIYDYIDDNMPQWAHEGVRYCVEHGIITGVGGGRLGLDDKDLKYCTMIMRMMQGVYHG